MNLIDYPPRAFARAEAATVGDVFPHVLVIAPNDYFDGDRGGNYVIVGSFQPLDTGALATAFSQRGASEEIRYGTELESLDRRCPRAGGRFRTRRPTDHPLRNFATRRVIVDIERTVSTPAMPSTAGILRPERYSPASGSQKRSSPCTTTRSRSVPIAMMASTWLEDGLCWIRPT